MKLLLDMNLSPRLSAVLCQQGHVCAHWSEIGPRTATDKTIMAWARDHGYVVLTYDLDFGAILAATQASGPSVVQIRTDNVLSEDVQTLLLAALTEHEALIESGALICVEEGRWRVRALPLRRA